jgi:hypothetical protein
MRNIPLLLLSTTIIFFTSCKKARIKKQITGTWQVAEMYTDSKNLLIKEIDGFMLPTGCDTLKFSQTETLNTTIIFDEDGIYTRIEKTTVQYPDTLQSRLQCKVIFADSIIEKTEKGMWKFEGNETLSMIAENNNFEGNKIVSISNTNMEWQTDLTVSQGFLVFNGIKTTKLIKR